MPEISHFDDVIDSRDVIERISELEDQLIECRETLIAAVDSRDVTAQIEHEIENLNEELTLLAELASQAADYAPDWEHGEVLIRDSYFVTYAMELVQDIGDLPTPMPDYIEIDWEATARNIRQDYTAVEFNDVTYWIR